MENLISYLTILLTKAEGLVAQAHAIFANYYMWFGTMQASFGILMIVVAIIALRYAYNTNEQYVHGDVNKPTGMGYREDREFTARQLNRTTCAVIACIVGAAGAIVGPILIACGLLHMLAADYYALRHLLLFAT